jgi:two-component system phosphate regulon response regulator PhoB
MKRILIVDDEPSTGALAAEYLKLSGYEVILVEDGETALARLKAGERFDLALVDKRMPGMSGIDLCQALRLDPKTRELPVILVSASVSPVLTATDKGVGASLAKPFSPKDLAATVRRVLGDPEK